MSKRYKKNNGVGVLILSILAIVILGIFLAYNIKKTNKISDSWERYAIIGKNNIIVVYKDRLGIKIPYEMQMDKDKTLGDIVKTKNYENVLESINNFLPEKVKDYKVIKYGTTELDVKEARNIPEVIIDGKRHILTSETQNLFIDLFGGSITGPQNLLVDILNANGIGGYARKTGESLKENIGVTYSAANYEKNQEYSMIVINEIDDESLEKILQNVNEKYFKIRVNSTIPTMANVVLILGKEENIDFTIDVAGTPEKAKEVAKNLTGVGYKNVTVKSEAAVSDKSVIEYNKDDYYIALKIAKKLDISAMIENNELVNKINIIMK